MLAAGHLKSLPQCGDAIFQAPKGQKAGYFCQSAIFPVATKLKNQLSLQSPGMNLINVKSTYFSKCDVTGQRR